MDEIDKPQKFRIIYVWPPKDEDKPCTIAVDGEIMGWLKDTFTEGEEYVIDRQHEVWIGVTEDVFLLLKLKWTQ